MPTCLQRAAPARQEQEQQQRQQGLQQGSQQHQQLQRMELQAALPWLWGGLGLRGPQQVGVARGNGGIWSCLRASCSQGGRPWAMRSSCFRACPEQLLPWWQLLLHLVGARRQLRAGWWGVLLLLLAGFFLFLNASAPSTGLCFHSAAICARQQQPMRLATPGYDLYYSHECFMLTFSFSLFIAPILERLSYHTKASMKMPCDKGELVDARSPRSARVMLSSRR